jgi:hypothetical protein
MVINQETIQSFIIKISCNTKLEVMILLMNINIWTKKLIEYSIKWKILREKNQILIK